MFAFAPATFMSMGGVIGVVAALLLGSVYDRLVDDPAVRRAVLVDYVHKSELDAANAKATELLRQKVEADAALLELTRKADQLEQEQAARTERMEQEIADYEKRIADADRCLLSRDDVEWLRQP
jgi:hypothetical protein